MLDKQTRNGIYLSYKIVIVILFVCLFVCIWNEKGSVGGGFIKKISTNNLMLIILFILLISSYDRYTGTLLGILIFIVYKFSSREYFVSSCKEEFGNFKKTTVKDQINQNMRNLLVYNKNPGVFSDKYYKSLFQKYYNKPTILERLQRYDNQRIIDENIKSGFEINYDLYKENIYKNSNSFGIE